MLKQHGLDVFVRVNSMERDSRNRYRVCVVPGLDGIMLAKTEAQEDVRALDALLKERKRRKGSLPEACR